MSQVGAWQASLGELGYVLYCVEVRRGISRRVMFSWGEAGMVGCVRVVCGKLSFGAAGEVSSVMFCYVILRFVKAGRLG